MRTKLTVLIAGLLACLAMAGLAAPASAADTPSDQQLLDQCARHKTDLCVFHPSGSPIIYTGSRKYIGGASNCSNAEVSRTIKWEHSSSTTNSWGVSLTANSELGRVFSAGVETSYGRSWTFTDTRGDEVSFTLQPKHAVRAYAAPAKTKINGQYELHFGSRYYGHYYWYVNGTVDGQTADQVWDTSADPAPANC